MSTKSNKCFIAFINVSFILILILIQNSISLSPRNDPKQTNFRKENTKLIQINQSEVINKVQDNVVEKITDSKIENSLTSEIDQATKEKLAYNQKLQEEIKKFETQYPPTLFDTFIDVMFSYMYFKKSLVNTISGASKMNYSEEYEKRIFKNRRLDALIKLSFENYLYDLRIKNEVYYCNNQSKLKAKVPLEDMSFDEAVKSQEYLTWQQDFLNEHKEYEQTSQNLNMRMSILFPSLASNFKENYLAQEMTRRSINYMIKY